MGRRWSNKENARDDLCGVWCRGAEKQRQLEEQAQRTIEIVGNVQLIYKRVILGVIIFVLLIFVLLDTAIFKQTIVSRNYLETKAIFESRKIVGESTVFSDCIYTFRDKQGNKQEIIVSIPKEDEPEYEIRIKYNKNNPEEYYTDRETMDKSEIIWYIVKLVALILLIFLFFNKKLLSKIGLSVGRK